MDHARADLDRLRAFDRIRIMDSIDANLTNAPTIPTRSKKVLHGALPEWEHVQPIWQLRVGDHRVFYDVDALGAIVFVRRILLKGTRSTGEIL